MVKLIVRFTTAPEAYDGFGTHTMAVVGKDRGQDVRQVAICPDHLAWQEGRYASGCHAALDETKWLHLVRVGIAEAVQAV